MASPEIGLLSLTQQPHPNHPQPKPQPHLQPHPNPNSTSWMWNPREDVAEDEESWEVRAFAEDTRNMMNTTWPPRSYTCTFCRREFRSAQALGGHMNVHRRDRARLHQLHPASSSSPSSPSSSFLLPPNAAGLCLLYHLPTPNSAAFASSPPPPTDGDSPSTLLSVSTYSPHSFGFPVASSHSSPTTDISSYSNNSTKLELPCDGHEELDLELRLGHRPTPTSPS